MKIRFGFADPTELAIDNSKSRITATKSFKREEKPKIKRRKPRQDTESTSSDEMPQLPRPTRKVVGRQQPGKSDAENNSRTKNQYVVPREKTCVTTPENTSISSANSLEQSSFEQSSSESLHRRKRQMLEARAQRKDQLETNHSDEVVKHHRLTELQKEKEKPLQRHHSNKW